MLHTLNDIKNNEYDSFLNLFNNFFIDFIKNQEDKVRENIINNICIYSLELELKTNYYYYNKSIFNSIIKNNIDLEEKYTNDEIKKKLNEELINKLNKNIKETVISNDKLIEEFNNKLNMINDKPEYLDNMTFERLYNIYIDLLDIEENLRVGYLLEKNNINYWSFPSQKELFLNRIKRIDKYYLIKDEYNEVMDFTPTYNFISWYGLGGLADETININDFLKKISKILRNCFIKSFTFKDGLFVFFSIFFV